MNKRVLRLLAGLIFLFGCVLAPMPLFAEPSNSIVISEIQTGGAGTGTTSAEFIELYNNSSGNISIDGWKVEYITASGATTKTLITLSDVLSGHGYALLVTPEFGSAGDFSFTAGLASTSGHVRLRNSLGDIVDMVGWGASATQPETAPAVAPDGGHSIARKLQNSQEVDTDNNASDFAESETPTPQGGSVYTPVAIDVCPNIDGDQAVTPDNYQQNIDGDCTPIVSPSTAACTNIELSELLANPAGDDSGREYIEIHNSSSQMQSILGCSVKVGSKTYNMPDQQLLAGEYRTFYSNQTGLQLTNNGGEVIFVTPTSETVIDYPALGDDQAWVLLKGAWQITDTPTPDSQNVIVNDDNTDIVAVTTSSLAPCPSGKYRNPATNRCKSFDSISSSLTPCKAGQSRNPETNRCRNIAGAVSTLTPCKAGQARNPETNRCRSVKLASASVVACKEGYERNPDTNRCRKVAAASVLARSNDKPESRSTNYRILALISFLVVGYGIYEYRTDARNLLAKLRFRKDDRTSSQQ